METSSLRDFPQQFRTFDLYLNDDDTISIVTLNVDPAVAEGSPAAKSRRYAIAVQQIVQNDVRPNARNLSALAGHPLPTMDPSRPQNDEADPTIQFADLSAATPPVPFNASYNAELLKPLSSGDGRRVEAAVGVEGRRRARLKAQRLGRLGHACGDVAAVARALEGPSAQRVADRGRIGARRAVGPARQRARSPHRRQSFVVERAIAAHSATTSTRRRAFQTKPDASIKRPCSRAVASASLMHSCFGADRVLCQGGSEADGGQMSRPRVRREPNPKDVRRKACCASRAANDRNRPRADWPLSADRLSERTFASPQRCGSSLLLATQGGVSRVEM